MGRHRVLGGAKVDIVFTDVGQAGPLSSSPDSFSVSVGAAGKRHVILGFFTTGDTISAITIGGASATKISETNSGLADRLQIWGASVPTGTSANVVVAHGGSVGHFVYGVWAVYNLKSLTEIDGIINNSSIGNGTLTAKPSGGAFMMALAACAVDETPDNYSLSGMTLNSQPAPAGPPNYRVMMASALTPGTSLSYTTAPFANALSEPRLQLSISLR